MDIWTRTEIASLQREIEPHPPIRLYKYVSETTLIDCILASRTLRYTEANKLNDPFEYRKHFSDPINSEVAQNEMLSNPIHYETGVAEAMKRLSDNPEFQLPLRLLGRNKIESQIRELQPILLKLTSNPLFKFLNDSINGITRNGIEEAAKHLGILSLTSEKDNLLMWAHYGNEHRGFLIEFDTSHPFFDISTGNADVLHKIRKVHYSTKRPALEWSDAVADDNNSTLFNLYFNKGFEWSYENEWRMVIRSSDKTNQEGPLILRRFPAEVITRIIAGCEAAQSRVQEVKDFIGDNSDFHHVKFEISRAHPTQYGVIYEPTPTFTVSSLKSEFQAALPDSPEDPQTEYDHLSQTLSAIPLRPENLVPIIQKYRMRVENYLSNLSLIIARYPADNTLTRWLNSKLPLTHCALARLSLELYLGSAWIDTIYAEDNSHEFDLGHSLDLFGAEISANIEPHKDEITRVLLSFAPELEDLIPKGNHEKEETFPFPNTLLSIEDSQYLSVQSTLFYSLSYARLRKSRFIEPIHLLVGAVFALNIIELNDKFPIIDFLSTSSRFLADYGPEHTIQQNVPLSIESKSILGQAVDIVRDNHHVVVDTRHILLSLGTSWNSASIVMWQYYSDPEWLSNILFPN